MATAGRATAFSGLTVAVGLMGLVFYKGLFFASIGIAGAIVVSLAVFYALTFLAALLAFLGPRIDNWRVPLPHRTRPRDIWGSIARGVMRRPLLVLLPTLALVILAGSPFLRLQMGSGGLEALPPEAESREAFEILRDEFPGVGRNTVSVVVAYPGDPLSRAHVGEQYDLAQRILTLDGVLGVDSLVSFDARLTREQYQDMYAQPRDQLDPSVRDAIERSVGDTIVVIGVRTDAGEASPEARKLVDDLRASPRPATRACW